MLLIRLFQTNHPPLPHFYLRRRRIDIFLSRVLTHSTTLYNVLSCSNSLSLYVFMCVCFFFLRNLYWSGNIPWCVVELFATRCGGIGEKWIYPKGVRASGSGRCPNTRIRNCFERSQEEGKYKKKNDQGKHSECDGKMLKRIANRLEGLNGNWEKERESLG